jgi:hypothetical protein
LVDRSLDNRTRTIALTHLRRIEARAFVTPRGSVRGQLKLDPQRFRAVDGCSISVDHDFAVLDSQRIVFGRPSELARVGPVSYAGYATGVDFQRALVEHWERFADEQEQALEWARRLSRDAHVETGPWRIEGTVEHDYEVLRLMFAPDGRRAVVIGLGGRPVSAPVSEPRVVLAVEHSMSAEAWRRHLASAMAQARRHAPEAEDLAAAEAMSIDLGSHDLV